MTKIWNKYRFQIGRRTTQLIILGLFFVSNILGWNILKGNLSSANFIGSVPLTDPFVALQMFFTGFVLAQDALIGAIIVVLFYAILAGRAFCSWVCPMNIVTDSANWLRKKIKMDDFLRQVGLRRYIRYFILILSLILSFFFGVTAFELVNPISMLHRGIIFGMGLGWTAILAVFFIDLFFLKNGFCGHLCPLGGFHSLISNFSLIRVYHDKEKCTECMECIKICPEKQVLPMVTKESKPVTNGECTNCGRCIEVCDDDAMYFASRFYKKI